MDYQEGYVYHIKDKRQAAQLARILKASLPNEWSYELAEEAVRDYVQRNFVDKGMGSNAEKNL